MGGFNATTWPLYPGRETRYPSYRRLGVPHGRSGRRWRTSLAPTGFEPRCVQPVESRYTDYTNPAALLRGKDRTFIHKCRVFLVVKGFHLHLNKTELKQKCKYYRASKWNEYGLGWMWGVSTQTNTLKRDPF